MKSDDWDKREKDYESKKWGNESDLEEIKQKISLIQANYERLDEQTEQLNYKLSENSEKIRVLESDIIKLRLKLSELELLVKQNLKY